MGRRAWYQTLKPRVQDAYRELGYPDGDVDSALKRAIVLLLKTPVVDGRIDLRGPPPLYTFGDDRLELLAGSQRQLLRMGPRNERIVQEKLRESRRSSASLRGSSLRRSSSAKVDRLSES